jgi:hypothetical protein
LKIIVLFLPPFTSIWGLPDCIRLSKAGMHCQSSFKKHLKDMHIHLIRNMQLKSQVFDPFFLVVVHLVFWGGGGKGYYNTIAQSKSLIPKSHLWAVLSNPLHDIILRNVDFRSMLEKKCWL